MMNTDLTMQMVSIVGNTCVILFFWDRLNYMSYSFWNIFIRAVFHRDYSPMDWLTENMEYLGFIILFVGHSFNLLGLLQEFSLNQLHDKPTSLFVSSPMNSVGIILICYIYAKRTSKSF